MKVTLLERLDAADDPNVPLLNSNIALFLCVIFIALSFIRTLKLTTTPYIFIRTTEISFLEIVNYRKYKAMSVVNTIIGIFFCSIMIIIVPIVHSYERPEIYVQSGHSIPGHSGAVSPNGKYLLTESRNDKAKTYILWDVESGREIKALDSQSERISIASLVKVTFSPDGRYALSAPNFNTLVIWDIQTGKIFKKFEIAKAMFVSARFSPNGKYISASGFGGNQWNIETGKATFNLKGPVEIDYSPDGKYIVVLLQAKYIIMARTTDKIEPVKMIENEDMMLSIKFSSSGKYLLGRLLNKDIKLWDTKKGKEIKRFGNLADSLDAIIFSPDDKYLLFPGAEYTRSLWDINEGIYIQHFQGHKDDIRACSFSPDGHYLMTSSKDKTLKMWNVHTGQMMRSIDTKEIFSIIFIPDSAYILTQGMGGPKIWDMNKGIMIREFKGNSSSTISVAYSKDGKYALCGGYPKSVLWDVQSGKNEKLLRQVSDSLTNSIAVFNDGTHMLLPNDNKGLEYQTEQFDNASHIDSLWNRIADDGFGSLESKKYITNIERLNDLINNPKFYDAWKMRYGKLIFNKRIEKLEKLSADLRKRNYSTLHSYQKLEIRNLNRTLLELTYPKLCPKSATIKIWNMKTGEIVRKITIDTEGGLVEQVALSPDNKYAVLAIYHAPSDPQMGKRTIKDNEIKKVISIIDIATGNEIKSHRDINGGRVAISPDGNYMIVECGNSLKLFDFKSYRITKELDNSDKTKSVTFSPDSKLVLAGSKNNIKLWNAETGKLIKLIYGHNDSIWAVNFSPDGKYFLTGSWDNTIKLWDASSGTNIRTFIGHWGHVYSVVFSPDGKRALSTSVMDGTTRLWDISTGKEILQFILFDDGEWISITPEGYYNSSINGHRYLNIRMGNEVYGIDQFYDVFYRPDIVAAKLRGEDISSLITVTADDAIKTPPPEIEFYSPPTDTTRSRIKVCYRAKSKGGGIGEVRIFHNGKLIHSDGYYREVAKSVAHENIQLTSLNSRAIYNGMRNIAIKAGSNSTLIKAKPKGDLFEDCKEVETVPGENEISISAFNRNNTVQSSMRTMSFKSNVKREDPHLYILAIGIDRYQDSTVNLKYAVKDARDLEEKLKVQSATLYKSGNVHHTLLTDVKATKIGVISKINELAKVIKPNDSFILFVAGHGVLLNSQYYLLTSDYNGTISSTNMISSNEIVEASKKIKSLSQLFIFDTCHAGGVDYIISGLYDARMSVLAKKMGLHIYASASDKQSAMDGYKDNGLFTYTLLDGLNNNRQADKNKDGKVTIMGLGEYSKKRTMDISKQIGHSQTPLIINFGKDSSLYQLR